MKINKKKSGENFTPKMKLKRPEWNPRRMKHGSYSLALSVIVIAAAVLLNLVVNEIPSQYTKIDLSSSQLSVLTDQTKELLSSLTDDITIYFLTQDSDEDETISRLLERYEDFSGHVTVVKKDPVLYPKFASQYTDDTLSENSLIVTCGEASRVIAYEDMYETEFDYMYYSYTTTGFDGEGQITSAISALSSDTLPKLYTLTGHGELELNTALTSSIEKENIETESLNLMSADCVPEDADALLIASPTQDLSDAEAQKILNYMKRGGQVLLFLDYIGTKLPNLESILEYYGVSLVEGVVLESDSNYYIQMPYYLLPAINSTDVSSDMSGGSAYVLLAAAPGLEETEDARDTLLITEVLSSSSSSYSKTDVENMTTYEKESDDVDGPFALGMLVTEEVELTDELLSETAEVTDGNSLEDLDLLADDAEDAAADTGDADETDAEDAAVEDTENAAGDVTADGTEISDGEDADAETVTTRLAVFTSSSLLDDSIDQMVAGGNSRLVMNTLSWVCGSAASVSVPVKSLSTDYLTVPAASGSFWSIVVIGLIPGAFLVCGLYIWLKRRKQ